MKNGIAAPPPFNRMWWGRTMAELFGKVLVYSLNCDHPEHDRKAYARKQFSDPDADEWQVREPTTVAQCRRDARRDGWQIKSGRAICPMCRATPAPQTREEGVIPAHLSSLEELSANIGHIAVGSLTVRQGDDYVTRFPDGSAKITPASHVRAVAHKILELPEADQVRVLRALDLTAPEDANKADYEVALGGVKRAAERGLLFVLEEVLDAEIEKRRGR